jgi:hypothetical protein
VIFKSVIFISVIAMNDDVANSLTPRVLRKQDGAPKGCAQPALA